MSSDDNSRVNPAHSEALNFPLNEPENESLSEAISSDDMETVKIKKIRKKDLNKKARVGVNPKYSQETKVKKPRKISSISVKHTKTVFDTAADAEQLENKSLPVWAVRKFVTSLFGFWAKVSAAVGRKIGWTSRVLPYAGYGTEEFSRLICRTLYSPVSHEEVVATRGWRTIFMVPAADTKVRIAIDDIPLKTVQVGSSTAFDAVDSNRAISGELMASDERGYLDLITEQSLDSGVHNVSYEVEGRKPIQSVLYTIPKTAKFGIISDIDDTILVTEVPNLPAAVVNVFFKHPARRKAVAGMSEFYGKLSQLLPVSPFFYLSTSPWNVEAGIRDFIRIHDFPRGPLLLRDFDPRPKSFIPSGVQHKLEFADQLMSDFPDMRFILIGDDGQSDPSTYAKIAEKYPGRVAAIGIRRVSKKELAYFSFSRTFNSQNGKFFAGTDIPVFTGTDGKSLMDAMLPYLEKLTGSKAH